MSMRATDLPGFDHVAFVGEHFGDAPGEFGVDVDLVRLDPAVPEHDAWREASLLEPPPICSGAEGGGEREAEQH